MAEVNARPTVDLGADVCRLVPPIIEIPEELFILATRISERAGMISSPWLDDDPDMADEKQQVLDGDNSIFADEEREAWPGALGVFKHLLGKPLTQEMVFHVLSQAMAASAIAELSRNGDKYIDILFPR